MQKPAKLAGFCDVKEGFYPLNYMALKIILGDHAGFRTRINLCILIFFMLLITNTMPKK